MTRETKIGLLVGLAFIIVIGILLSDHLSSTNEPLGAPLRVAADTLRSGLGQPSNEDVAPVLRAPQAIVPQQSIVTNEELKHHTAQPPTRFVAPPVIGQAITPAPGVEITPLQQIVKQHGEELINADSSNVNPAPPGPITSVAPPISKTAAKTYIAETGDSLSTMAQKAYGSGCRANREAIVAANPSLVANRDLIVAGRTYIIPALDKTSVAVAPAPAKEKPSLAKDTTYVVKAHDTLWSIAMSEVGTASAVAAIKDLNQDILNGSDRVRPNMKLILPAKKSVE